MRKIWNKAVALVAVVVVAAGVLAGCGSVENNEVVATVGDSEIVVGVANFYARYIGCFTEEQQMMYASYYGGQISDNEIWEMEVSERVTLEELTKEEIMDSLHTWYVLEDHMEEYKVSLTDKENQAIADAVQAFLKANKDEAKQAVSADEAYVKKVLELMTISEKMYDAMVADVDTTVEDKDVAKKAMQYVKFPFTSTNEDGTTKELTTDEIKKLKTDAENFLNDAKDAADFEAFAKEKGYTATKATFDKDTTTPDKELIQEADKLNEGEFTEVIETDSAYYVAKLTSLLDREATDAKKEEIVKERQDKRYQELLEEWKEETKIDVNKSVWGKISFDDLKITAKEEEQEESTNSTSTTGGVDQPESTDTTE